MSKPRVQRSKHFRSWYKTLTSKDQGVVDTRIDTYKEEEILVNIKSLDKKFGLYEFKWTSGMRVYFSFIEDKDGKLMLLLLGENKNSQSSDINDAKKIVLKAIIKIKKGRI